MIHLAPCPKHYAADQDKAITPEETLARVKARLAGLSLSILSATRRIDNGRLGIPVFLSVCGDDARHIMPTRKQMGKGASAAQAEASALMELMERYGFFTYWQDPPQALYAPWSEAEARFGDALMPIEEIVAACHDNICPDTARRIMNLRSWCFVPASRLEDNGAGLTARVCYVPLDLFRQLGEFNGSSAGNTDVESLLQGACELIERHVCCLADRNEPELPTIDCNPQAPDILAHPVLSDLLERFYTAGIEVLLKDCSMGMPVPTVAALAYDSATFPDLSEIVFTAGTATSPAKAAIRALTEVAQLAGDFNSKACYEASGLSKYEQLSQTRWLRKGPTVSLSSLPSIEAHDMLDELRQLTHALEQQGFTLYTVATTNPDTAVPTHYSFAPGLMFRERDINASLGLFVGRMLSEEADPAAPSRSLDILAEICPNAHYIPFFQGMAALHQGKNAAAAAFFAASEPLQPGNEAKALAAFYLGYCQSLDGLWQKARPALERAVLLCPDMKGFRNHLGVCLFKLGLYAQAQTEFAFIIERLDKGSAVDLQNLGLCLKFQGQLDKAAHYLAAALALDSELEAARKHLDEITNTLPQTPSPGNGAASV